MSIFEALELVTLLVGVVVVAMGVGAMRERLQALERAVREYHDRTEQNVQRIDKRIDDTNQTLGGLRVLSGGRGRE